jgi:glutaconate CoA-transferase subunit B
MLSWAAPIFPATSIKDVNNSGHMITSATYSTDEMMTIAASRLLGNGAVCFVGIGLPSAAANLARLTHAPDAVLIYESGTVGAKPSVLPLSIGDSELAETADFIVSIPEIFRYWLQAGRIDVGFLGAAQIDRFGNINTTVIGDYQQPKTRLPGAGGAPEIASSAKEVFVVLRQNPRGFVGQLDFITSAGYLSGGNARDEAGIPGRGPTHVVTDIGILQPDPQTRELIMTALYPGKTVDEARAATGWPLKFADQIQRIDPPDQVELDVLRDLHQRTATAHQKLLDHAP